MATFTAEKIDLLETPFVGNLVRDYLTESLKGDWPHLPRLRSDNLKKLAERKRAEFPKERRKQLQEIIQSQMSRFEISEKQHANIKLLTDPNCFTFTTAHQVNLFTGPLYVIIKGLQAIKTAAAANAQFPEYKHVPVFWVHTEDHDIAEMNHLNLFGKQVAWSEDFVGLSGEAPPRLSLEVIDRIADLLGATSLALGIVKKLRELFSSVNSYGEGAFAFLQVLFADHGLLILDQHSAALKKMALPIFEQELFGEGYLASARAHEEMMEERGYKRQAYLRLCNLFLLHEGKRRRIERDGNGFLIVDTELRFSAKEMANLLENDVVSLSPNVALRPVFQECVLPNLAYIGGGGELAYWLQLPPIFKAAGIAFPSLVLRNSVVTISSNQLAKIAKLQINYSDLWAPYDGLVANLLKSSSTVALDLNREKEKISDLFTEIKEKAVQFDGNLEKSVESELKKVIKSLENIEQKIVRAEKRNSEQVLTQLNRVRGDLFPGAKPSERRDNFLQYYSKYGADFITAIYAAIDPFNPQLNLLKES